MAPEPGNRPPAPEPVRLVQRFINSTDREGPELLADPAALRDWLVDAGLLPAPVRVSAAAHARALALREALRELTAANAGLDYDPDAAAVVDAAGRRGGLSPVLSGPATARLQATAEGVDGALAEIVASLHAGIADGTWTRLKACERGTCRWAFYDNSKNGSGHWCSMAVCGSREKNQRAYRRRRARAGA
jgi:predicted RNA-binding Zn ribbon-like protein